MKYADLKKERDDAIARAVEAERLSMKSEFDRLEAEHAEERKRLAALVGSETKKSYANGFRDGQEDVAKRLMGLVKDLFNNLHQGAG